MKFLGRAQAAIAHLPAVPKRAKERMARGQRSRLPELDCYYSFTANGIYYSFGAFGVKLRNIHLIFEFRNPPIFTGFPAGQVEAARAAPRFSHLPLIQNGRPAGVSPRIAAPGPGAGSGSAAAGRGA